MRIKEKEIEVRLQQVEVREITVKVKATTTIAAKNTAMQMLSTNAGIQEQLARQAVTSQRYQLGK